MHRLNRLTIAAVLMVTTAGAWGPISVAQDKARAAMTVDPEIIVPPGTILSIYLTTYLNTRSTQVGDHFYADIAYPVWLQQRLIIPKGSTVRGTVTEVVRPGKVKGKGRLAVRVEDILLPNGVRRDLNASFRGIHGPGTEKIDRQTETVEAAPDKGRDAGQVIGLTATGAGAAVGLATVLLSRGQDLVLEPGTEFELELKQPLKFVNGELDFTNSELNSARTVAPRPRAGAARQPGGRHIMGLPVPGP